MVSFPVFGNRLLLLQLIKYQACVCYGGRCNALICTRDLSALECSRIGRNHDFAHVVGIGNGTKTCNSTCRLDRSTERFLMIFNSFSDTQKMKTLPLSTREIKLLITHVYSVNKTSLFKFTPRLKMDRPCILFTVCICILFTVCIWRAKNSNSSPF